MLEQLGAIHALLDEITQAIIEIDRKVEAMADGSQVTRLVLKIDDLMTRIPSLH